jgi:hypothetical protein
VASISHCALPAQALLCQYEDGPGSEENYTDCYTTRVSGHWDITEFVFAFLTTWLFRLERALIRWFAGHPSSDGDARQIAAGADTQFAVWRIEGKTSTQLLLCDSGGATRSWFMVQRVSEGEGAETILRFGSAIVAQPNPATGRPEVGRGFRLLLPFHQLYSRALLHAATSRLGCLVPPI